MHREFGRSMKKRLMAPLAMLLALLLLGSLGFFWIEGYSWTEAIYMTLITASTVGFGEVRPLTGSGMLFTCVLIITSMGTFAYAGTLLGRYFLDGDYRKAMKRHRLLKITNQMQNHVIICGCGRVGDQALSELQSHNQQVVVIEKNSQKAGALESAGVVVIRGDATEDELLGQAGIVRATALITTLPDDAANVYVVLAAREQNPKLRIISRAAHPSAEKKLRVAGARNVIMPNRVGGAHMASLVAMPDVIEFMDHIRLQGEGDVNLEEVGLDDLPSGVPWKTIHDLDAFRRLGVNVIGLKRSDGSFVINPAPEVALERASKLFVLGDPAQIGQLQDFLQRPQRE